MGEENYHMKAISGPALGRPFVPQPSCGTTQGPSAAETRVIEANVAFYLQTAEKYDSYETYLFDPDLQQTLEDDLDIIGSHFSSLGRTPSCLECGGGTGNLTLKMCARGWAVTVVDVSEKMLGLLQEKPPAQAHSPNPVHVSTQPFLQNTIKPYHPAAF